MTKNGIRIKKEKKEQFISACLKCDIKVQKSNVVELGYVTYILFFKRANDVFQAGYYFSKFI